MPHSERELYNTICSKGATVHTKGATYDPKSFSLGETCLYIVLLLRDGKIQVSPRFAIWG